MQWILEVTELIDKFTDCFCKILSRKKELSSEHKILILFYKLYEKEVKI